MNVIKIGGEVVEFNNVFEEFKAILNDNRPAAVVFGVLLVLKVIQLYMDRSANTNDNFIKTLNKMSTGARGFYDTQLEILQRMAKVGEEEFGGLSAEAWNRLSDEEKENALMARLTRETTALSEEALPVFGFTWFKVEPNDF